MKLNKIKKLAIYTLMISGLWGLSSCSDNNGPEVPSGPADSTVLIYAVATNSLSGNLISDKAEMLEAAENINLNKNNILLFETKYARAEDNSLTSEINLLKLVKSGDTYGWETVKSYSNDISPLNPSRISDVISYVANTYKAETYGLVFWSHSSAAQPSTENTRSSTDTTGTMLYSFGQDKVTIDTAYINVDIDDLADAIPSGLFNFIWFDSCYMSNIESIYQLRHKCNKYIGYATEVYEYGMPYEIVLPHMTGKNPDLENCAELFFNYYAESPYSSLRNATVAVADMTKIDLLADYCREIYGAGNPVSSSSFIKYTRGSTGPFYDLGDYTKALAESNGVGFSRDEWDNVLDGCITYKGATPTDFNGKEIPAERYSGLSTHVYTFNGTDSDSEKFYKSLDWYKAVFAQ